MVGNLDIPNILDSDIAHDTAFNMVKGKTLEESTKLLRSTP
jgi:hypothetical protein